MKKLLVLMTMLLALTTTANAQKLNDDQRDHVIKNLNGRMQPYGNWYITTTPVTWYEYWAVTGVKKHTKNTSVSKAAIVLDGEQKKFCDVLNKEGGKTFFLLLSKSEAFEACNKGKLHDDVSNISFDHGFYVKMSKKNYQYLTGK